MQTGNPKESSKNQTNQSEENDYCIDLCCLCCFFYYCCNIFDENEED